MKRARPSFLSSRSSGPLKQVRLRIIGGEFRSRLVDFKTDLRTRPMKDRTREAIFNRLGGKLSNIAVADLFSGSGIMAFESLSRGADFAVLIELLFNLTIDIKANIANLKLDHRVEVIQGDTFQWADRYLPRQLPEFCRMFSKPADLPWLVLCCPPYQLWETDGVRLSQLLRKWIDATPAGSEYVVELDERTPLELLPNFLVWTTHSYPPSVIALAEKPVRSSVIF